MSFWTKCRKTFFEMDPVSTRSARLNLLIGFILMAFVAVGIRMASFVSDVDPQTRLIRSENTNQVFSRGDILDRNGVLLASNLPAHSIYAHPHEVEKNMIDEFLNELEKINPPINIDRAKIEKDLLSDRKFVWLSNKISPDQSQQVNKILIKGVYTGEREARVYPNGRLASHILGGASFGEEHVYKAEIIGVAGVEKYFNELLNQNDLKRTNLTLSIDVGAQQILTEMLDLGIKRFGAKGGSAVLMNVHTGEVIAMVSLPDFDPNRRSEFLSIESQEHNPLFNMVTQGTYELGSTFKIFSAAMALEENIVQTESMISTLPIRIKHKQFSDKKYHNELTVMEAIARSKNTASIRMALGVGNEKQRKFLMDLGLGKKCEIQLHEAAIPSAPEPRKWNDVALATISFGHGISVTPLHLATAYSMLVNGGYEIKPTLLRAEGVEEGRRIIAHETSRDVVSLLLNVVNNGTARETRIEGYQIGGKTGTSEKIGSDGNYLEDKNFVIFASVFSGKEPNYSLVVMLDEASSGDGSEYQRQAGSTVVPLTGEIIARLGPMLGLIPENRIAEEIILASK